MRCDNTDVASVGLQPSGRTYTAECLKEAVDKINAGSGELLGSFQGVEEPFVIERATHICRNFTFKDGYIKCDVEILNTPDGEHLKMILEDGRVPMKMNVSGRGYVDENGIVSDFEILYVNAGLSDGPVSERIDAN
jgi:hypothetical protein